MQLYREAQILGGVSWFVTLILGVLGNMFILSTIITRLKQKKNTPNALIFVLSLTDLVCVLLTYIIPGISYVSGCFVGGNVMCNVQTLAVLFINTLSFLVVLSVVFERYYAVARPYAYQGHMVYSLKKILAFVFMCIVLSVAIALPAIIYGHNSLQFPGTFCMIDSKDTTQLRVKINVIFYTVVLFTLLLANIVLNSLSISTVRKMTSFRQQYVTNQNTDVPSEEYLFMRLCLVTLLISILLWTPLLVYFILALIKHFIPDWYTMLAYRLAALHCVVNPWLYPILRKRFRSALNWHVTTVLHYLTFTLSSPHSDTLA